MRLKLFLLVLIAAVLPAVAQMRTVKGIVVNASSDAPIPGVSVTAQGVSGVITDNNGTFVITLPETISRLAFSIPEFESQVVDAAHDIVVRLLPLSGDAFSFFDENSDLFLDEELLDDDSDNSQTVAALTGANDDIYYNTASYNFGPMYFRFRGYDSAYQSVYINGVEMNDLIRGRFNFSSLLGMTSRAFRNKTTTVRKSMNF